MSVVEVLTDQLIDQQKRNYLLYEKLESISNIIRTETNPYTITRLIKKELKQ